MLILLNENIAETADQLSDKEVEYLDDLLLGHSKLYHYVGAAKRVASELKKKLDARLSRRSLQTLELISSQSSELPAIIRSTKFYAMVQLSEVAGVIAKVTASHKIWVCDLQFASKWFSQPSTLIGENLIDAKMLNVAATDMALESGLTQRMQRINFEMSGGCGNAWEVLKNRIESALCPVLCIIDSDKYMPTSVLSPAVEKCISVINEMNGVSGFFEIEQREIENLLPRVIVEGAISMLRKSPDRDLIEERFLILENLRKKHPLIYRHVDLKEGTCRSWAKEKKVYDFFSSSGVVGNCGCRKDCEGLISPPIFKDVLAKALEFVDSKSPAQLHKILINEERPSWLNLGQMVMSFSLANSIRTT